MDLGERAILGDRGMLGLDSNSLHPRLLSRLNSSDLNKPFLFLLSMEPSVIFSAFFLCDETSGRSEGILFATKPSSSILPYLINFIRLSLGSFFLFFFGLAVVAKVWLYSVIQNKNFKT